jgi:hypothetical protein
MEEKDKTERPGRSAKVEVRHETVGTEVFTIVKTAETTTRIDRRKLHQALQRIIRDPKFRAGLEANPADAMAEMGIDLDSKEKSAIAGKRLSEVFALLGKSESGLRGAVGYFPESIIDVVINTMSSGPETVTATVSGAVSEGAELVTVETAGEETVVVLVIAA